MAAKKILWFSQHELTEDQVIGLKLAYGDNIEINHVNQTVNSMYDIKDQIEAADVVAMVGTVDMQSQAIKIADGKPVLTAISDRLLEKDEQGNESKVTFAFNRWEQIKQIAVESKTFDKPESVPANILWLSRHTMAPDQAAALNIGADTKLNQIDKTIKNAYEIQDAIKEADIIALVAPVGIQQQALKLAEGKPVVTAVNDRIPQPDGSYQFHFNRWEQVISITIDKETIVTKEDVDKARNIEVKIVGGNNEEISEEKGLGKDSQLH